MKTNAKQRERERLAFTENRDGTAGAVAFARQGMLVYRKALAQRNQNGKRCGYGQAYRLELVESCIVFRQFLRANARNEGAEPLLAKLPLD